MSDTIPELSYEAIFFAFQPIFNFREEQIGYEMLYRNPTCLDQAVCGDWDEATLNVAACGLICTAGQAEKGKKPFINFSNAAIIGKVPYAIPPGNVVVEIQDMPVPPQNLIEALRQLVADGYEICIDHVNGSYRNPVFPELATWAKYDVLNKEQVIMATDIARLGKSSPKLIALRVENRDSFMALRELGVEYFQGFYFKEPRLVTGRKLSSHQTTRLRIFREIEREEPDLEELAATISSDVGLSYRLLRYLNSAAFSLPGHVDSIKQALLLLGLIHIKHWLRVVLLTDLLPKGKTRELSEMSVKRGKFFELVAKSAPGQDRPPAKMFLLGLFSMLEAMLDRPMAEIANDLPIEDACKKALCGEAVPVKDWLDLVAAFEQADWPRLTGLIAKIGLDTPTVAKAYFEAGVWTNGIFEAI